MFIHGTTFGRRSVVWSCVQIYSRVYFATAAITANEKKYSQLNCTFDECTHGVHKRRRGRKNDIKAAKLLVCGVSE